MGLFDRLRGRGPGGGGGRRGTLDRSSHQGDLSHLEQFVATRRGVEGYVEPRTAVTETTIVLVAADGEWTRRRTLDRGSHKGDLSHLEQFVASRRGVEGYVEPRTTVTETTIVLVAADGEWTRRRIDGPEVARRLSRELAIPVYDAQVTGYPQRMRDWSARQKNGG